MGVLCSSPTEQIAPLELQRLESLPAGMLAPCTAGKGKLPDVANNLQQLKLHQKHLAWKIRQSRKNSIYHQYNTAEISFLEIIISDSSSKNKGQKEPENMVVGVNLSEMKIKNTMRSMEQP